MKRTTRQLLATTSLLGFLATGAVACDASIDEDGAELNVDEVDE
ncbi:MAG: hypothetical protein WEB09_04045 [Nitriliruptor sp.]